MEKSVFGSFGGIDAPVVFLGSFLGLGDGVGVSAHVDTLFFLLSHAFNTMVLFISIFYSLKIEHKIGK